MNLPLHLTKLLLPGCALPGVPGDCAYRTFGEGSDCRMIPKQLFRNDRVTALTFFLGCKEGVLHYRHVARP
jgi:hypothetical protein